MSEHRIELRWTRNDGPFERGKYNLEHEIHFSHSQVLRGSPSQEFGGDDKLADPEQLFLSAISACHMLTFLAVAANRGYVIDLYQDNAVALLEKNAEGKLVVTKADLWPKVVFAGEKQPSREDYEKMQQRAHEACFIANSVKTEVTVHP